MNSNWTIFEQGSYNKVSFNDDLTLVLKERLRDADKTDAPERSVRLFNQINQHTNLKAKTVKFNKKTAWISPYVWGEQASDMEISSTLIDIFNETGRIVVDATADKNFIKSIDGKIICVDVGMAFYLDQREEFGFHQFKRQKSIDSLEKWEKEKTAFDDFFKIGALKYPQTISTIKALLYLKKAHPDIFNVHFLKYKPELRQALADAYTQNITIENDDYLNQLQKELSQGCPQALHYLKENCKIILRRYISSRGSINHFTSHFSPSLSTSFFNNQNLTAKKIKHAQELISNIDLLFLDAFYQKLKDTLFEKELIQGEYSKGLLGSINRCLALIDYYHLHIGHRHQHVDGKRPIPEMGHISVNQNSRFMI